MIFNNKDALQINELQTDNLQTDVLQINKLQIVKCNHKFIPIVFDTDDTILYVICTECDTVFNRNNSLRPIFRLSTY